jgi:hypothetical protein
MAEDKAFVILNEEDVYAKFIEISRSLLVEKMTEQFVDLQKAQLDEIYKMNYYELEDAFLCNQDFYYATVRMIIFNCVLFPPKVAGKRKIRE